MRDLKILELPKPLFYVDEKCKAMPGKVFMFTHQYENGDLIGKTPYPMKVRHIGRCMCRVEYVDRTLTPIKNINEPMFYEIAKKQAS